MDILKLGTIPFLNAKPITYGLERGLAAGRFALEPHTPSRNAELLAADEPSLDLAIIPSIEYARHADLWIVPGIAIASRGDVLSVQLYTGKPVDKVKTIAVDARSRTSVALLQILCAEYYGIKPELKPMEPEPGKMLKTCDAALMIGDDALYSRVKSEEKYDLGAAWCDLTGQPFVYAFWAGHAGILDSDDVNVLLRSLQEGLLNINKIASNHPALKGSGIDDPAELNERYLSEHMRYSFGEAELTGLKLFYIKAWEQGLIDGVPRLRFYEG
ncbi:MAG TPA: menaquinone biosynthesis protein [Acidobacteriota bacterium]|nr:menaquinone biosynthesis protein [Acidobacteriota bacterium]